MQDLAHEIAKLIEPSEPLGFRLVIFGTYENNRRPCFEAKAVKFKGGVGFLVRCDVTVTSYNKSPPQFEDLPVEFAPNEDALKFLIRTAYNSCFTPDVYLLPPGHGHVNDGLEFQNGCQSVRFCNQYSLLECNDPNSASETRLREAVAALTLMTVPEGLKG